MAFDFFRRRQKLVIIVMVILMVSFLISFQGLEMLFPSRDPSKLPVGQTQSGKILGRQVSQAGGDLQILSDYLRLGELRSEAVLPYLQLLNMGDRSELAFVLLQQEARNMGITVTGAEIDVFLSQLGWQGAELESLLDRLRSQGQTIGMDNLRSSVGKWLLVQKAYESAVVLAPPSEQHLKHLYQDLKENIQLQYVRVPAEKYLDQVAEPSAEEIDQQFQAFRNVLSATDNMDAPQETFPATDSFGFGYKQPNRVKVDYLLVQHEPLRRALEPSAEEILRYFEAHRDQFTKEVPLATQPSTAPATQPAPTRSVRKTLREAEEEVVAAATEELVQANVDAILRFAEAEVARLASQGNLKEGQSPYDQVAAQVTLGPDDQTVRDALEREVPRAVIDRIAQMPLDKAVRELARGVKLQTIVYPWGRHGEFDVDPKVKVTLRAQDKLTLGAALEQITQQVFGPTTPATAPATQPKTQPASKPTTQPVQIRWGMFTRLRANSREVLFPYGGEESLRMFPIAVGKTALVDRQELAENQLLRSASSSQQFFGGQWLTETAFQAAPFQKSDKQTGSTVRLNEDRRAYVFGDTMGVMLWRLTQAVPAYVPETIDSIPGLRQQVARDIKIKKAFEKARQEAQKILASGKAMEEAAKARNLDLTKTEMLPRKQEVNLQQMQMMRARLTGHQPGLEILLVQPVEFVPSRVPGLSLPTDAIREEFLKQAFALAPENPEASVKDPSKPAVIALPSDGSVLVAQRVDYRPPVVGEYEDQYRPRLANQALAIRQWRIRSEWFNWDNLAKRTGFTFAENK